MQKISNTITGRTVLPAIGNYYLTFGEVSQVVFAEATVDLTVAAYAAWQTDPANATEIPFSVTQIMGDDATPKLLVEYTTTAISLPTNSLISQVLLTEAGGTLVEAIQTWKSLNPLQKIIRVTQLTGFDGGVNLLVEYGIDASINYLENNLISQVFFQDDGGSNTSYSQYLTWKNTATNSSLKPYRLTYVINKDGSVGILVEYTTFTTVPSVAQLQLSFVSNDTAGTFASNLQAFKTANPSAQIYRVTAIFQGFLIEYTLNGIKPANNLVSQSAYAAAPGATDATDAYQVFKTANPTLKPIRLTAMTWGDGTNTIVAEYIS